MLLTNTRSQDYEMIWHDYMPNIAWGTVLLSIVIFFGYIGLLSGALAGTISYPLASMFCTCLCFASFTVMHDAGHGNIVKMGSSLKFVESIMGWMAAIPLLVSPYRLFQKIHDRHHAFTNDPARDPDHFGFGTKWYQVLLNTYYMPIKYIVMSLTTLRHIKIFRDTYVSSVIYLLTVCSTLIMLVAQGYVVEVLSFAVIPTLLTVFLLVMFFDYVPHHPHKSQDRLHNTRIYPSKILNVLLLGQNYHLIHHMYPRLPWYTYQGVFKKIRPYLESNDAPIEYFGSSDGPRFMASPNAKGFHDRGHSVNSLLKVSDIKRETDNSVEISFQFPPGEKLVYKAGQYIMISRWLAGEQHARCYSLCQKPGDDGLKIGVRETQNGLVSKYLNRELQVGDELIVQGPFGDFIYPSALTNTKEPLVLIAGGSGITPILSILETALAENSASLIHLIYACKSGNNMMFYERLRTLLHKNKPRLKIDYVVSSDPLVSDGYVGRLTGDRLLSLLSDNTPHHNKNQNNNAEFYICGPEGLKDEAMHTLADIGVPREYVHIEQFSTRLVPPEGTIHRVDIKLIDGQKHVLNVASNQTVLDVAKSSGVMIPHACEAGSCGTCKFKVEQGQIVEVKKPMPGISLAESDTGFTLACQCKPKSDLVLSGV